MAAIIGKALQVARHIIAADHVEHQIDAALVGDPRHFGDEILGVVIDGMGRAEPASAAAHLSALPAVTMTVMPSAVPSWIAVTPMPLVPPWTSRVSPGRAWPRSITFDQTVNQVSGRPAASTIAIPAGTGRHCPAGAVQYSA